MAVHRGGARLVRRALRTAHFIHAARIHLENVLKPLRARTACQSHRSPSTTGLQRRWLPCAFLWQSQTAKPAWQRCEQRQQQKGALAGLCSACLACEGCLAAQVAVAVAASARRVERRPPAALPLTTACHSRLCRQEEDGGEQQPQEGGGEQEPVLRFRNYAPTGEEQIAHEKVRLLASGKGAVVPVHSVHLPLCSVCLPAPSALLPPCTHYTTASSLQDGTSLAAGPCLAGQLHAA